MSLLSCCQNIDFSNSTLRNEFAAVSDIAVKTSYLGILMCLWDESGNGGEQVDGMKIKDLGKCAGVEPSTMTGLLDRMENDGLVCRSSDPGDRRALRVKLTPAGISLRELITAATDKVLQKAMAGIDDKTADITKKALRAVLSNIGEGANL